MATRNLEREIIDLISRQFSRSSPYISRGIGDDAACLSLRDDIVVASDILYENVHFRLDRTDSLSLAGEKAFLVNISDLFAKGILGPYFFIFGLGISRDYTLEDVSKLLSGIETVLKKYDSYLIGGDVFQCDKLCLSVTILGRKSHDRKWFPRRGLQAGDSLYITAPLGMSSAGLYLQENNIDYPEYEKFRRAHYSPDLPYETVLAMQRFQVKPSASIDLSDSLVETLHLLSSDKYTLHINGDRLIHPEVRRFWQNMNKEPWREVFTCGEDYQLLLGFNAPPPDDISLIPAGKVYPYKEKHFVISWEGRDISSLLKDYFRHFE